MAILLTEKNRVLVCGGTGGYGSVQLDWLRRSGTAVVGLVSPGRGGQEIDGLPVFDLIGDAAGQTGADTVVLYIPAPGVRDAVAEAADAGMRLVVAAAELVPVHDSIWACAYARDRGTWVVGPNTAGIVSPGRASVGSIPQDFTRRGPIGVMSRSGTLSIISARILTRAGIGQSTVVSMGGDQVIGRTPADYLREFLADPETSAVVCLGEVGGTQEYDLLELIAASDKPVFSVIVGRSVPRGKRMGHAGALARSDLETAEAKRQALRDAGAVVVDGVDELARAVAARLPAAA